MFTGETNLDEIDSFLHSNIGCWIALEWNQEVCKPPKGVPFGTHLATFLIGQYGCEIRGINFCWLYSDDGLRFYRVGTGMQGVDATWFFRYSTLKKFRVTGLPSDSIALLGLPDLSKKLHDEVPCDCFEIRKITKLDTFRHPGFPDDVQVATCPDYVIPENRLEVLGEQVWVRLNTIISQTSFTGVLLNNTLSTGWKKGDQVQVNLLITDSGGFLYCVK